MATTSSVDYNKIIRLKHVMVEANISVCDLAEKLNVGEGAITDVLNYPALNVVWADKSQGFIKLVCDWIDKQDAILAEKKEKDSWAEPRRNSSARINEDCFCKKCGWPVVHLCCNDDLATTKPYAGNDWWEYCSNKTCQHHTGEGVFQFTPDWVQHVPKFK